MRCFALYITDAKLSEIGISALISQKATEEVGKVKKFKSNDLILLQNCFGASDSVAIEFDLQTIAGKTMPHFNITLHNINRYWFSKSINEKLKGKKIVLYAGTKLTPLLNRQGVYNAKYTSCYIYNDFQMLKSPLFSGYIQNAYTEHEGATTSLNLTVNTIPQENNENVGIDKITSAALKIPKGAVWYSYVKSFITKYYLKKLSLPPIIKKGKITNKTSDAEVNIDNIKSIISDDASVSLQSIIETNFNCSITVSNTGTLIIADKEGKKEDVNITAELENNIISDNDLLTQPAIANVNDKTGIILTLPLTNRFNLEKKNYFSLLTRTAMTFQTSIIDVGDTIARYDLKKEIGKYWYGSYKIDQIWHVGSSRNSDVNAWVTKISAMPEGDMKEKLEELAKTLFKKNWLN